MTQEIFWWSTQWRASCVLWNYWLIDRLYWRPWNTTIRFLSIKGLKVDWYSFIFVWLIFRSVAVLTGFWTYTKTFIHADKPQPFLYIKLMKWTHKWDILSISRIKKSINIYFMWKLSEFYVQNFFSASIQKCRPTHCISQSSWERKLLALPQHPPYRKTSHRPEVALYHQRGMAAIQGPGSFGSWQGETRNGGSRLLMKCYIHFRYWKYTKLAEH